jgi:hypothetical protein
MVRAILGAKSKTDGRRAGAIVVVALSALVVRCGGESKVNRPDGSAAQGPQTGGTGGTGVGGSVGGVGGPGMGASGGRGGMGGAGGMGIGGTGASGQGGTMPAGMAGAMLDPFAHCMVPPLVEGTLCSFEETCGTLDCGKPWALQGADGCLRTACVGNADCAAGERCVPAVVAGAFDDWLTSGCESCEYVNGLCSCTCLEGGGKRAVCLDQQTLPAGGECPVDDFSCEELDLATSVVQGYEEVPDFQADVLGLLGACRQKIFDRWNVECALGGQGGAGGEGGE